MDNITYYRTPMGVILRIVDNGEAVKEVNFFYGSQEDIEKGIPSELGKAVIEQLNEYFDGTRKEFDLPLDPLGTPFQKKVWKALLDIPYGQTRTYKEVAEAAGCPKGARAVGNANNRNHICIIIPCHRCIASDGTIGGYDGGIEFKERLLDLECCTYKKSE